MRNEHSATAELAVRISTTGPVTPLKVTDSVLEDRIATDDAFLNDDSTPPTAFESIQTGETSLRNQQENNGEPKELLQSPPEPHRTSNRVSCRPATTSIEAH